MHVVPPGGDFQAALNEAQPGDTIVLQAGATYVGDFTLPNKTGNGYITVETSALSSLPPANARVSPADAQYMPKLESRSVTPSLLAVNGAHDYRFIGIEFRPSPGKWQYEVISVGTGTETSVNSLPHDIIFDRDYIHGDAVGGTKRGIGLNGIAVTVENSYLSDFMVVGQDAQALCGWNGPGPYTIVNNFIEAAGENVLFGGAKASIPGVIPSNILIKRNYIFKPLSWRAGDPSYAGTLWQVKNLMEFKNARNVTVEANVLQHDWSAAQHGSAVLFTPRTMSGESEWAEVENITFENNIVEDSENAFDVSGFDNYDPEGPVSRTHNITIQNNLLLDINGQTWGVTGNHEDWLLLAEGGPDHLTFNHNTGVTTTYCYAEMSNSKLLSSSFVFTNNIVVDPTYGLVGGGVGTGTAALNTYARSWTFAANVDIAGNAKVNPIDNYFPATLSDVGFTNLGKGDLDLLASSPYYEAGTDGKPVGADYSAVVAATSGVIDGTSPSSAAAGGLL
jgi:hypothetical protein